MIALPTLAAPAKRALVAKGIESLHELCPYTRREVASWHGIGPNALFVLEAELLKYNLAFKMEEPST
ncbi:DNA-binding protein [Exiguobacterium sp. PBE]|uniref:hypothetical protein n=1 Tax=unclassified Exiguobacterium TaxID=2644629 RepID=UPI000649D7D9|nr:MULTISPECIES: hypothetical protein [unclassified Exiguobacterium]MBG0918217.1 DNA-binding protein [Exiguobacterium sp. SRB7LM]MCV9900504.1 hypothetical protein [Exiguobacterium sp. N5]MDT0192750.1 hypothetical protein [Exiguobacterium sp. BG5(2022)]QPI67959.1 DNA-binding protein [Exiguobacterium sp. PBE]